MSRGILLPHHYRTAKLASKFLSRDDIEKAPSDARAAILIAPAATAHCFDISRPVPLVHIVELLTESFARCADRLAR